MHISPWTIYWIMQLDAISSMLGIVTIIAAVATFIIGIIWIIAPSDSGPEAESIRDTCGRWGKRSLFVTTLGLVVTMFLPTTKTAAAMVIAPAIVNSPTVQHEAGDLYRLAKQALQSAMTPAKNRWDTHQPQQP